jgi:hypothetical protein
VGQSECHQPDHSVARVDVNPQVTAAGRVSGTHTSLSHRRPEGGVTPAGRVRKPALSRVRSGGHNHDARFISLGARSTGFDAAGSAWQTVSRETTSNITSCQLDFSSILWRIGPTSPNEHGWK